MSCLLVTNIPKCCFRVISDSFQSFNFYWIIKKKDMQYSSVKVPIPNLFCQFLEKLTILSCFILDATPQVVDIPAEEKANIKRANESKLSTYLLQNQIVTFFIFICIMVRLCNEPVSCLKYLIAEVPDSV